MSVINKMLRDLDSRRAADTLPVQTRESRTGMASDTVIVNDSDRAGRRRGSLHFGAVLTVSVMVLVGAAGAWWYLNQTEFLQRKVDQAKLVSPPCHEPAGDQRGARGRARRRSQSATCHCQFRQCAPKGGDRKTARCRQVIGSGCWCCQNC